MPPIKILLIQAKQKSLDRFLIHPPYGLLYLASVLRKNNFEVKIYDANILGPKGVKESLKEITGLIDSWRPDVAGIGGMISSFKFARIAAKEIKDKYPRLPLIGGGLLISAAPELVMKHICFDAGCIGEAEEIVVELFERAYRIEPLDSIPGLAIRKGEGEIKITGSSEFSKGRRKRSRADLDWIPLPSYDLIELNKYLPYQNFCGDLLKRYLKKSGKAAFHNKVTPYAMPVFSGRGCPFTCTFCFSTMDKRPLKHSVDYVISHLEYLEKEYGINHFQFLDENFNIDKSWVMEFCRKIIAKGNRYYFTTGNRNRAGFFDKEMLDLMKEANFYDISVGVESLDDRILSEMSKGLTSQKILETLSLIKSTGIEQEHVRCLFGFPSDSKSSIYGSIKKGNAIGYKTLFAAVIPLPGTRLFEYCLEKGIINDAVLYLEELHDKNGYRNMTNFKNFSRVASIIEGANAFSELDYCLKRRHYCGYLLALVDFLVVKKIARILEILNLKYKVKQFIGRLSMPGAN